MAGLVPYIHFPGSAREALTFYHGVFGGAIELHTRAEFGSTDGSADAIAHGMLTGPVDLFAADSPVENAPPVMSGIVFSLLGTADPRTLESWFTALADAGTVIDPLQERPWGAHDGTLTDRYGITWLIGYEV